MEQPHILGTIHNYAQRQHWAAARTRTRYWADLDNVITKSGLSCECDIRNEERLANDATQILDKTY